MKLFSKAIGIFIILSFVLVSLSSVIPQKAEASSGVIVSGDNVYFDDSNVFLQATPQTLTGSGWVELTYQTKNYNGAVDVVCGFAGADGVGLKEAQVWESYEHTKYRSVEVTKTATFAPEKIVSIKAISKPSKSDIGDVSLNSNTAEITYEYKGSIAEETKQVTHTITYNTTDGKSFTYDYKATEAQPYYETYADWNKSIAKSQDTYLSYAGASSWQISATSKVVNTNDYNKIRIWIEIPFRGKDVVSGKYVIGIKPSGLSVADAKAQGKLWVIDPWYSASWLYRKSFTITNASNDYQTKVLIGESAGAVGEDVDLGSHIAAGAAGFDELRFTGDDGTTQLDYWIESITGTTPNRLATVWVQNAAVHYHTGYMYYGSLGAAAVSSGVNTFDVGKWDNFEWGANGDALDTSGGNITWVNTNGVPAISTEQEYTGIAADTRSAKLPGVATGAATSTCSLTAASGIYAIQTRFYKEAASDEFDFGHGNGTKYAYTYIKIGGHVYYFDGAERDTGVDVTEAVWHLLELRNFNFVAYTYDIYVDGSLAKSGAAMYTSAAMSGKVFIQNNDTTVGVDSYTDNLIIRKWAAAEQTFGSWGSEVGLPAVTTQAASAILSTSAILNGNITALGSSDNCTERGFVWGIVSKVAPGNVTPPAGYSDNYTYIGSFGTGAFTHATGAVLVAGTTYYYRAFARSVAGWSYGAEVSFSTLGPPAVTVSAATLVEETSATLYGNITSLNGNASCDSRGFEWDFDASGVPYAYSWTEAVGGYGTGIYSKDTSLFPATLLPGTLYYMRAKATGNLYGTGYSSESTFLTKPEAPTGLAITVTSSSQLTLAWTKGSMSAVGRTMVRYKVGVVAPISITDGTQAYLGAGIGYGHSGLDPGQTISYSVWSEVTTGGWTTYSDSYVSGTATTSSMSIYLDNFQYYVSITVTSSCNATQELRIPFIINSAGLVSGGYVQSDFDDVVLARVDTLMPLTVTDISASTLWKSSEATSSNSTTMLIDTTLTQANDYWNGCILTITETTDGLAPQGESKTVTDYDLATHALTFGALTAATTDGDLYTIGNYRSKYLTNLELAPYQQVVLRLYLGYAAATPAEREFCTDESDTITIGAVDHADFDITDNLTVAATVKIFDLPGAVKTLVYKNGSYELGIDAANKPYLKVWHPTTATATGSTALVEDTEYVLKGTYNNASDNLSVYVDSTLAGSTADAGGAISTTDNVTVLMDLDNCEVDDIMIGRTSLTAPTYSENLTMEAGDIGAISIVDHSVSAHNVAITWDISLPSCITVEVGAVTEVATWGSPPSTEAGEIGVFELPTEPTNWMPTKTDFTGMPAYELIHAAGSGGGIWGGTGLGWSDATMYRILVFFTAIGVGTAIGVATASALLTGIATGVVLAAGTGAGIIGWWVVLIYGLFAMGYIVASRSM